MQLVISDQGILIIKGCASSDEGDAVLPDIDCVLMGVVFDLDCESPNYPRPEPSPAKKSLPLAHRRQLGKLIPMRFRHILIRQM